MQSLFRSAVTVCLVKEASQGPFVYHCELPKACAEAKPIGFDAIELFPTDAGSISASDLAATLTENNLKLAAVGSGAGWVRHKLSLTSRDAEARLRAKQFIKELIGLAGAFQAPVIVGSMQGRIEEGITKEQTLAWLRESLHELSEYSFATFKTNLLYEPLNRYETNIFNRMVETGRWLEASQCEHVKVLVDLFHANIEEASIADSIRQLGTLVGHVHFADSNRMAIGYGHTEVPSVIKALQDIQYDGYLSAEVSPLPDSQAAAVKTMEMFRHYCR